MRKPASATRVSFAFFAGILQSAEKSDLFAQLWWGVYVLEELVNAQLPSTKRGIVGNCFICTISVCSTFNNSSKCFSTSGISNAIWCDERNPRPEGFFKRFSGTSTADSQVHHFDGPRAVPLASSDVWNCCWISMDIATHWYCFNLRKTSDGAGFNYREGGNLLRSIKNGASRNATTAAGAELNWYTRQRIEQSRAQIAWRILIHASQCQSGWWYCNRRGGEKVRALCVQ